MDKDTPMTLDDLKLGTDALEALLGLALKVELHANRRFKATRNLDDFIDLLRTSQRVEIDDVRQALNRFAAVLTQDPQAFLRLLGVEIQPRTVRSRSYRGQAMPEAGSPERPTEAPGQEGKTRIVYRGREHWK